MIDEEKLLIVNDSLKVKQSTPLVQNPAFTHLDTKVFGVNYNGIIEFPPDEDFDFEFINCIFNNVTFVSTQSEAGSLTFKYCIFKNCTFKENIYLEAYDCLFMDCTFNLNENSIFQTCIFDGKIAFQTYLATDCFRNCSFEKTTELKYWRDYVQTLTYDMYAKKNAHRDTVYLVIPEGAKVARNPFNPNYVDRCDRAIVKRIVSLKGEELLTARSHFNPEFIYEVGKEVRPDSFDERWWITRTHGIHCKCMK